jgi:hypothetical protein
MQPKALATDTKALDRDTSVFGDDVEASNYFDLDRWNRSRSGGWQYMPIKASPSGFLEKQKVLAKEAYTLMRMAVKFERLEGRDDKSWKGDVKLTCKNANDCRIALYSARSSVSKGGSSKPCQLLKTHTEELREGLFPATNRIAYVNAA